MHRLSHVFLLLMMVLLITTCAIAPLSKEPMDISRIPGGVYAGKASSWPNKAEVRVTMHEGRMVDIALIRHWASWIGKKAEAVIPQRIIEKQSADVDAVTGATNSSRVTSLKALAGGGARKVEGLVTTLSEFGLFFRVPDLLPAKTRLPIHIEIKGRTISLEAVVLYSCSSGEGPFREQGMGMKFVKISPQDRALIKAYILEEVNAGIPG